MITFTLYQSARSTNGRTIEKSWPQWVAELTAHDVRGQPQDTDSIRKLNAAKDGPAIVLGPIPNGQPRRKANVQCIYALALDIEQQTDQAIITAFEALADFDFVYYTTHKHGAAAVGGGTRLRVIVPLAEPLAPDRHAEAWARFGRLVGGVNDPATKDIGRLHYLPSTFDPAVAKARHNPGRRLSLADLPAATTQSVTPLSYQADEAADAIRRKLNLIPKTSADKPLAQALMAGTALAGPGGRHEAIRRLTWGVARKNAELGEAALSNLFAPSLATMAALDSDAPGFDDVLASYGGAVEKIAESDAAYRDERRAKTQTEQAGAAGPYTQDDLTAIAEAQGWKADDLHDRWILQREGMWWFLNAAGRYAGPYGKEDAAISGRQVLARSPVRLMESTKNGYRWRSLSELASESGTVAEKVISDFVHQHTTFDPASGTLYEAIRPLRRLDPAFDPEIDRWLQLLAGPLHHKLVDWLSCVGDLSKLLCAIYLDGKKGSGKTLLPTGLARLWTEGPPAEIELVLGDFNEELARCPLILADEEIPKPYRTATVTTKLRSMISTPQRTLKRKFKGPSELRGAIRMVLAANNEFLLDSKDVAGKADLEAIAERFLYIKVPGTASEMLNGLPRSTRTRWAESGIARHALWLMQNHEIAEPGQRFWVEGDVSEMHRMLLTGTRWNSMVIEWLVRYCMKPSPFETKATGLIRRGEGELLVNDQALIDGWGLYKETKIEPETQKIGAALRAISGDGPRRQLRYDGRRIRYRTIDVDTLLTWSDRHIIGDRETILANLNETGGHLTIMRGEDADPEATPDTGADASEAPF